MIKSNGLQVEVNFTMEPCGHNVVEIRKALEEKGYAYLKGFLPERKVRAIRQDYFRRFCPDYCTFNGEYVGHGKPKEPHGHPGHPAYDFVRDEPYQTFMLESRLGELCEAVLNEEVVMLKRKIVRHFEPGCQVSSKAHRDFAYLNRGDRKTLTAWIPLGDVSPMTGGLAYLSGKTTPSRYEAIEKFLDKRGLRKENDRFLTSDLSLVAEVAKAEWVSADFRAGDVMLHDADNIHASLDCQTAYMRLSSDVRFARKNGDIDPRWLDHWSGADGY